MMKDNDFRYSCCGLLKSMNRLELPGFAEILPILQYFFETASRIAPFSRRTVEDVWEKVPANFISEKN
ncbi:MAG TPA: hypothetical protein VF273_02680 [Pelobium sp.]